MKTFKNFTHLLTVASLSLLASSCVGIDDSNIRGELTMNPRSGWNELDLIDTETKKSMDLKPGRYTLTFKSAAFWSDPTIEIKDAGGKVLGNLAIPAKSFHEDGTFEYFTRQEGNRHSYNILGGRRKITHAVSRGVKLDVYCPFKEEYTCTKERTVQKCSGEGEERVCKDVLEEYETTCTRTVSGEQDQLHETEVYSTAYRILFDALDLANVAEFRADGEKKTASRVRSATGCTKK